MFYIINSLNLYESIGLVLLAIIIGIFSLIKYKNTKAPWKVVVMICILECILLIINRIIKEYAPNTSLYQTSFIFTLVGGAAFILSIFIGAYVTHRKK